MGHLTNAYQTQWLFNHIQLLHLFPRIIFKKVTQDSPGGSVVKNPTCHCRRHGFDPWSRKIPHAVSNEAPAPQLLSLRSIAQELQLLSPQATTTQAHAPQIPGSAAREAATMRSLRSAMKAASACHNQRKSLRSQEGPAQPKISELIS